MPKKAAKRNKKVPPIIRLVRLKCGCICTSPNAIGACYKIYFHDKQEFGLEVTTVTKRMQVEELQQFEVDLILGQILHLVLDGYEAREVKEKLKKYLGLDEVQRRIRGMP